MLPERGRRPEAGLRRDPVHRQVRLLQQLPCPLNALLGQPLERRDPDLLPEAPGEGPYAHRLPRRQFPQTQRPVQMVQRPGPRHARGGELRLRHRPPDVLRLAALPVRRHDRPPRHVVGHRRPVITPDHVQTQIDPGGDTGRRQHLAGVRVQHLRIQLDRGEQPAEVVHRPPVRGRPPPVQQPGRGQHERPRTDRRDPRPGPDPPQRPGQLRTQPPGPAPLAAVVVRPGRRYDHGVGRRQHLRPMGDMNREIRVRQHLAGPQRTRHQLIQRLPVRRPGLPEDPVDDAHLHGQHPVPHQHHHPMPAPTALLHTHGSILTHNGHRATRSSPFTPREWRT